MSCVSFSLFQSLIPEGRISRKCTDEKFPTSLAIRLAVVNVEAVAVDILDGELPYPPGLLFQRIHDVCAERFQLLVRRVDVAGENPVNGGLKWRMSLAKEYRHL